MKTAPLHRAHGFTLVELMLVTAITAILTVTAYPSLQAPVLKARRIDGIAALLQLQMSQERWRSEHSAYASAQEIKLATLSSMGHYQLSISDATAASFVLTATAQGAQAQDKNCKVLQLSLTDGNPRFASGASASVDNTAANNKRCWNQ